MRPKLSAFVGVSLDGFIARKNGDTDFLIDRHDRKDEDYGYRKFMNKIDVVFVGRKTYEMALTFKEWPYKGKRVFVLSDGTPEIPESLGSDVMVMHGNPKDLVELFSVGSYTRIYVDGGNTIQRFIAVGKLNEITITTVPVLIGEGIPLFGSLAKDIRLSQITTHVFDNGYVQTRYRFC
jgi:dihydrofolate reductase